MAIIYSYPVASAVEAGDLLIGTDITGKQTKNFSVGSIVESGIPSYISGTINTIPVFTGSNTIGDSIITQNATGDKISVNGSLNLSGPVTSSFSSDNLAGINLNVVDAAQGNVPDYFLISLESDGSGLFYAKTLELGDGENVYGGAVFNIDSPNSKFLFQNGDVGIGGDVENNRKLKVHGNSSIDGNLYLSGASNTYSIEVGQSRTAEGGALLDLTGELNPATYGLRLIRYGGENAQSAIIHAGTGDLIIRTDNSADTLFENTNVKIGTNNTLSGSRNLSIGFNNNMSGTNSIAAGVNNDATGDNSVSFGNNSNVSGNNSIGSGFNTGSSGTNSLATGKETVASGNQSVAFGDGNTASGVNSIAAGLSNVVAGSNSLVTGNLNSVSGTNSFAAGQGNTASGLRSMVLGFGSKSLGDNSVSIGFENEANTENGICIGKSNDDKSTGNDPNFLLGQGNSTDLPATQGNVLIGRDNSITSATYGDMEHNVLIGRALNGYNALDNANKSNSVGSAQAFVAIGVNNALPSQTAYPTSIVLASGRPGTGVGNAYNAIEITEKLTATGDPSYIIIGDDIQDLQDDAEAASEGVPIRGIYKTGNDLKIRTGSGVTGPDIVTATNITASAGQSLWLSAADAVSLSKISWSGGNGTFTLRLPPASSTTANSIIRFITDGTFGNGAGDKVLISARPTQTIDGVQDFELNKSYEGVTVWTDGTEWFVIQAKA